MSVSDKPPSAAQATVMQIFQQTMNEANLEFGDAVSVALMHLGLVISNVTDSEVAAHEMINEAVVDLHAFINDNYRALAMARDQHRGKNRCGRN